MSTFRAIQVTGARGFAMVERELSEPPPNHVRLRVEACGVCRTDAITAEALIRDPSVPRVPGHEVVGVIDALGAGVEGWRLGDRVGVGWLNGPCGVCDFCRRGRFVNCTSQHNTGASVDGGYAEVMFAKASGLVRIPEGMAPTDAAPLLCAGVTMHSALQRAELRPGDLVAVQGIGGLGHLGVQYAAKLGLRVAAISRGSEKAKLARQLGAEHYIDASAEDPAEALQVLGGATAIIATSASGESMSPLVPGLRINGRLIVVGITMDPIALRTIDFVTQTRSVIGVLTGSAIDNEDSLAFAQNRGIRSMNEVMPLSEAPHAYERMMAGDARFRVVLDTTA